MTLISNHFVTFLCRKEVLYGAVNEDCSLEQA